MFSNIPLPKLVPDAQPGGGLNAAYNQIAQNALKRKLLEAESQSKSAYANWVGPQSLMSFLNTPGIAQNLGPDQYKALTNLARDMSMNALGKNQQQTINPLAALIGWGANKLGINIPGSSSGNVFTPRPKPSNYVGTSQEGYETERPAMPEPETKPSSPQFSYGGEIPNKLIDDNLHRNGYYNPDDPIFVSQFSQLSQNKNPMATENIPTEPEKPVVLPKVSQGGLPQTSATQLAQPLKTSGEAGGLNQPAIFSAEELGMKQYNQGQIANILDQQNKIYTADSERANEAFNQNTLLETLKENYSRLGWFEKGNWTKLTGQAFTDAAQEFDNKKEQLVQSVAKNVVSTGHVTDAARLSAEASKTGRGFNPKAFEHLINFAVSQNDRMQEKPLFDQTFSKLGFDPQQTEILWRYYNTRKPFYNNKTHEANDDNLLSWDKFYSRNNKTDNLRAAFSPAAQKEINSVYRQQKPQSDVVMMVTPEGERVPVHRANIGIAKNRYKFKEAG